jgi:hypothetical protein
LHVTTPATASRGNDADAASTAVTATGEPI